MPYQVILETLQNPLIASLNAQQTILSKTKVMTTATKFLSISALTKDAYCACS